MELSRSYPGSAFTEYYPSSQTQYYGSFQDYSRPSAYPGTYDVHTARSTLTAPTYTTKTLGTDTFPTATPWNTLPTSPWDPKPEGLLPRPPDLISTTTHHPVKRKRKTTPQQRLAANIRERRRMCNLNTAFDRLRRRVPAFPHEKRLSRIQTLRLAITYISFMTELLSGQDIRTLLERQEATKPVVWQPYELEDGPSNGSDLASVPPTVSGAYMQPTM